MDYDYDLMVALDSCTFVFEAVSASSRDAVQAKPMSIRSSELMRFPYTGPCVVGVLTVPFIVFTCAKLLFFSSFHRCLIPVSQAPFTLALLSCRLTAHILHNGVKRTSICWQTNSLKTNLHANCGKFMSSSSPTSQKR